MTNILLFLILVGLIAPGLLIAVTDKLLIAGCHVVYCLWYGLLIAVWLGFVVMAITHIFNLADREWGFHAVVFMLSAVFAATQVASAINWLRQRRSSV
jgi:hypothetical protein